MEQVGNQPVLNPFVATCCTACWFKSDVHAIAFQQQTVCLLFYVIYCFSFPLDQSTGGFLIECSTVLMNSAVYDFANGRTRERFSFLITNTRRVALGELERFCVHLKSRWLCWESYFNITKMKSFQCISDLMSPVYSDRGQNALAIINRSDRAAIFFSNVGLLMTSRQGSGEKDAVSVSSASDYLGTWVRLN